MRLRPIEWRPHWPSIVELMQSASDGCHLCAPFLLQMSPQERVIFKTYESEYAKKYLHIGVRDSADRTIGPYDLYLSHPVLESLMKQRFAASHRLCVQMRPTQDWHAF